MIENKIILIAKLESDLTYIIIVCFFQCIYYRDRNEKYKKSIKRLQKNYFIIIIYYLKLHNPSLKRKTDSYHE